MTETAVAPATTTTAPDAFAAHTAALADAAAPAAPAASAAPATELPPTPAQPPAGTQMSLALLADMIGVPVVGGVELGKPSCIAVMAEPGAGKSTLLGGIIKVPEYADAKVAYVDVENGTSVWALDPQIMHAVETGQITVFKIDKTDPMAAKPALDKLLGYTDESGQKQIGALFSPAFNVDVIGIDTFSTLQEIGLAYFMATSKNKEGVQDALAAYGKLAPWTNDILWSLQHGKPLGLVASHTMEKKDKKTGIEKLTMKLSGSAKDNVASIPDLVAYMGWQVKEEDEAQTSHLVAHMTQSTVVTVKNRYGFKEPFWDFTLPALFAAVNAKIDASKAIVQSVTQSTSN